MIGQSDQASNQYGFYAIPKAVEPKKKYRETYDENEQYDDEEYDNDNMFETLDQEPQNQRQLTRDYYVDEAPYPEFKPKERGLDYGVQIQKEDLFDFDLEVKPLIEILVGRSVVNAINELQQQKEKNDRDNTLDTYQKKRNAQLMVTQRLEAKSKRKQEEADRRVLQKQIYVKNKKLATKKLIGRKNAKHCLLNLKADLLCELEEDGYLREDTFSRLKVEYQGWMYEQIRELIDEEMRVQNTLHNMVNEKEKQIRSEHQKNIDKENQRRREILDERQRVRKENQLRKMKKRIRKQRLQLNNQRADKADKAEELIEKYEKVAKILKSGIISNGLTKRSNNPQTVHISGGLINFILEMLNSTAESYSEEQIQAIFDKISGELGCKFVVDFSQEHLQKIQEAKAKMDADPIAFMKNKAEQVNSVSDAVDINQNITEISLKSLSKDLRDKLLKVLLNNYLNCLPAPKMQGEQIIDSYEATDIDKKREQRKERLEFVAQQKSISEEIFQAQNIVRVRFENIRPEVQEEPKPQQQKEKPVDLDEWIDIFDGEGWEHDLKEVEKERDRNEQGPANYGLPGFENTFIVDERNLYFLTHELAKLLDVKPGERLQEYIKQLTGVRRPEDKVPIYDVQLKWE